MSVVGKLPESDKTAIRAFHVNVAEAALSDLRRRFAETRLPEQETVRDYSQGVPLKTIQQVLRYWQTDYDWRKVEAKLNFISELHHRDRWTGHSLHPRPFEARERAAAHRHARLAGLDHRAA